MSLESQTAKTTHLSAKNASRAPEGCHPWNLSVRIALCPLGGLPLPGSPGAPPLLPWGIVRGFGEISRDPQKGPQVALIDRLQGWQPSGAREAFLADRYMVWAVLNSRNIVFYTV